MTCSWVQALSVVSCRASALLRTASVQVTISAVGIRFGGRANIPELLQPKLPGYSSPAHKESLLRHAFKQIQLYSQRRFVVYRNPDVTVKLCMLEITITPTHSQCNGELHRITTTHYDLQTAAH